MKEVTVQIETTAGNLKSALAALGGIIERRSTIPVLSTVRIGGGTIEATNLDIHAKVALPTIGKTKGKAAIDYHGLAALARLTPADEHVSINDDDGLATVAFNGSEYRLASLPVSDFPDAGKAAGTRSLTGNMGIVAAMRRVMFAISTEEIRYYLNGVAFMQDADGETCVCATDGHRLAYVPIPAAPNGCAGKIVPRQVVAFLAARKAEPVAITFDTDKPAAHFEFDGLSVFAKLIDGTYPDIWRVIPKEPSPRLTVHRDVTLAALRRIAEFSSDRWRGVKLSAAGDTLTLTAGSGERSAKEIVPAELQGEPFECGYNVRYLIEALSRFGGDVTLACSGNIAGEPAALSAVNDSLRVVMMPMRV